MNDDLEQALSLLPDGWFTLVDVDKTVSAKQLWCLEDDGMLEVRPATPYKHRQYRKIRNDKQGDKSGV